MDFQQTWQRKVQERLARFAASARAQFQQAAPNLLYGFLSAMALWPVAEAMRGGDLAGPILALGGIVGNVGVNLIANQVQGWKDEADAAEQLSQAAQADPDVREALDTLLSKLDVIGQAQANMSEADRDWFQETLRREVAQLGSSLTVITITDSEVVAVGDRAAAASAGDVAVAVGGDVRRSTVITGENNSVTYIVHQYLRQGAHPPDRAALFLQIANYLAWMMDRCGTIELRGIKREGQQVVQLDLDTIYVPLKAVKTRSSKSVGLDEVLGLGQRIIITGGPGSGKTTVLLHVAWTLATAIVADNLALAQEKLGLRDFLLEELRAALMTALRRPEQLTQKKSDVKAALEKAARSARDMFGLEDSLSKEIEAALTKADQLAKKKLSQKDSLYGELKVALEKAAQLAREKKDSIPLPIFVPLSAYATHLRRLPATAEPQDRTLAAFISRYLIEKQTSFNLPSDFFQQLMGEGRAVILLLDGLDEVPNEAERVRVRQAIEELVTGRETMCVLVTCRTAAYKDRTALGKGFREVRVKPLDDKRIEALVQQAYVAIYRHDPSARREKAGELLQGIRNLEAERRRRLGKETERLVSSPLLVRMLLVVHFSERRLPEQRAELYVKTTDAMLLPEYALDEEVADRIGRLVGGSREIHRDLVQHLAFAMHNRGEIQGREIHEDDLRQMLSANPSYAPLVDDFIALTRLRGTLLEERLGIYRFIHLAFQEFLAARYLAEIVRAEAGVDGIAAFLEAGPILDSWWREPSLLVAGYLSVTSPQTAQMFLRRLAGVDKGAVQRNLELSTRAQIAAAKVAVTAFLEWQAPNTDLRRELIGRLAAILKAEVTLSLRERVALGDVLARLGDSRPGVGLREDGLPDVGWCKVPEGPFLMGTREQDIPALEKYGDLREWYERETPQHQPNLPAYSISKYLVTYAQYAAFVQDSGYHNDDWWKEAIAAGYWSRAGFKGDFDKKPRIGPATYGSAFDLPNHPVVGVSWYEAVAFCRWLTERLREAGEIGPDQEVTLPTEAQWEKAARGEDGRIFPWGDEFDPAKCNMADTGIGTTSAVGIFPKGGSPYGVLDLSGNVWEWCRTKWRYSHKEPADESLEGDVYRVLRGGAFDCGGGDVRCTCSLRSFPSFLYNKYGFRVCLVSQRD